MGKLQTTTRLHFGRRSFGLCHPGRLNKKTFGHRSFGGWFPNVLFLNPDCARNHFTLCGIHADSLEPAILCNWLDENSVVIVLIDIQQPSDACDFLCRKERISVHLLRQCLRGNADGLRDIVAGKACADDFGPQIQIFAFHDNNLLWVIFSRWLYYHDIQFARTGKRGITNFFIYSCKQVLYHTFYMKSTTLCTTQI